MCNNDVCSAKQLTCLLRCPILVDEVKKTDGQGVCPVFEEKKAK
jgi:hypothetical protein